MTILRFNESLNYKNIKQNNNITVIKFTAN